MPSHGLEALVASRGFPVDIYETADGYVIEAGSAAHAVGVAIGVAIGVAGTAVGLV